MKKIFVLLQFLIAITITASVYEVNFNKHPFTGNWYLPDGFSYDARGGESGSGALRFQKNPGTPYRIASHPIKLEPGAKYRLTVMVRCENIEGFKGKGIIAVEYNKSGKHVAGNYYSSPKEKVLENGIWEELELKVSPPAAFDTARIAFYLGKSVSGTVWYDNLRIEKAGAVPPDIFDLSPSNLTIRGSEAELTFKAVVYQPTPLEAQEMKITAGEIEEKVRPDANGCFKISLSGLVPGDLPVAVELRNIAENKTLGVANFKYFVTAAKPSANASWINTDGSTMVDGKPFFPIGFYCSYINEPMLERVSKAGANFIMPYAIGREKNISAAIDLTWKHNLKVLFNVMYQHENAKSKITSYRGVEGIDAVLKAWVDEFRDHPALLGWYLSDENPREELPRLRQMREMINAIDPDHFTVTLTYRPIDFAAFVNTGDVFATDPYPIETSASRSMSAVSRLIGGAAALTPRVWMVPQAFSWGTYRKYENPNYPWRFPTEIEIRSMVLSGAVAGAKGFLFYSYNGIFGRGEERYPGTAEENWGKIVPVVKLLRELGPFLLSPETHPEVTIEGNGARAKAWMLNGKPKVIITSDGPGNTEAIITVPGFEKLKSRFRLTENLGGGKYRFNALDIGSDILE